MRFDAYAGNVRGHSLDDVAALLASSVSGTINHGRGVRRYGETLRIETPGHLAGWCASDQVNDCIYFECKGETSPEVAIGLRAQMPGHTVSRLDVCEDYDQRGAFEALQALVRGHKGPRVQAGYVALPDEDERGRTWAAGVRGGVAMVRVYEAGKMKERAHVGRPHWTRAELECRPHYAKDKAIAANLSPVEVWGLSGWTSRVGHALMGVEVPRYLPPARQSTHDSTTLYIARKFRRHLEVMLGDFGSWECVGREVAGIWAEDDAVIATCQAMKASGQG
jgi:hypothetical protein